MQRGKRPTLKQKEDAYTLYCEGVGLDKIARIMGVARPTVSAWKKRYDWVERSNNLLQVVKENNDEELTDRKIRRLKYYRYLQDTSEDNVRNNPDLATPKVGLEASKMELLELGEATERSEVKSVDTFKNILTTKKKKEKDEYD